MNGLDLFAGSGIGSLVFIHTLFEYRTIGYVESNRYCRSVIRARIRDGVLSDAPLFDDIHTFNAKFANRYVGKVDIIYGGDPCQDNSVAAPRGSPSPSLGEEFIEAIRQIKPGIVIRENPAVVRIGAPWPAWRFCESLKCLGYRAVPIKVSACCFGADHRRRRLFVFATITNSDIKPIIQKAETLLSLGKNIKTRQNVDSCIGRKSAELSGILSDADVCRKNNDVPHRVDRLKMLGNGWVPQVVARILKVRGII